MSAAVIAYPFVSAEYSRAAEFAGCSVATIKDAVSKGDLVVHYVGPKNTKPVIRALDLDAWIESQPTERAKSA